MMFFKTAPLLTHAEQHKLKRKTSNGADPSQQDNYIITHYGLEYYTPVTESSSSSVQLHNDGYFTAEVIPVDPKTGEELKTINNLYVPLHTGYSIGAQQPFANDRKATNSLENDHQPQSTNIAKQSPPTSKYKFEKKYKFKNADAAKKNSTSRVTSQVIGIGEDAKTKINSDDANKRIKQVTTVAAENEKFSPK